MFDNLMFFLKQLHELYKLRSLPDLVEVSVHGNPMCTLLHHKQLAIFLLRSLEVLDGDTISAEERIESDERFAQGSLLLL